MATQPIRQDLINNWQRANDPQFANDPTAKAIASYGSLDAYAAADAAGYPGGFGKSAPTTQAVQATPQINFPSLVQPTTPADLQHTGPTIPGQSTQPATSGSIGFPSIPAAPTPTPAPAAQATPVQGGGNFNQSTTGAQLGDYSSHGTTNQLQEGAQNQQTLESQQQHQTTAQNALTAEQQQTQQNQTGLTTNQALGTSQEQQIGATTGTQTGSDISRQLQTGGQSTSGTTVDNTTGTQHNVGSATTRTEAITPFDIQSLIEKQLPQTAASDAARNAYLTDFMQTGGTQFGSQVDQAVRNSLTGPQMTGAGDSARARAAGYAGAQVARTNADQRLGAASQLAGPSALGTLTQQSAPLFGQQSTTNSVNDIASNNTSTGTNNTNATNYSDTSGTNYTRSDQVGASNMQTQGQTAQNNVGTSNLNTTGSTNTTGQQAQTGVSDSTSALNKLMSTVDFQKLVGNETNAGTASGSSASNSAGTMPEGQPVQTGGCMVCTAYVSLGEMHPGAIRRAALWKQARMDKYGTSIDGYMHYGPLLARAILRSVDFARLFRPLARSILYHENYLSAPTRFRWRLLPFINHEVFDRLSYLVGLYSHATGKPRGVQCEQTKRMLVSQNLNFSI